MKQKTHWRPIYILFFLLAALLTLVGQWGAGILVAVLTLGLSQLVRVVELLERMTAAIDEPAHDSGESRLAPAPTGTV